MSRVRTQYAETNLCSVLRSGEAALTMYRIYFLDRRGAIQAREEFDAPSDGDAVIIGSLVADVCSETYASYEIWSFKRRVVEPLASIPAISLAEISEDFQEQVLKLE